MKLFKDIRQDVKRLTSEYDLHPAMAVLTNRGIHALLAYRLAHALYKSRIPFFPLFFTRLVQIIYSIDIDYRARLSGGIVIMHGVGIVIGSGAVIKSGVTLYHDVTLGRKMQGGKIPPGDGFPTVHEGCVLGAGARLLGKINVGHHCIIGCNTVITFDVASRSVVKVASMVIKEQPQGPAAEAEDRFLLPEPADVMAAV